MLVLSRNPGERILIGDSIVITIIRIGPASVRLGIDAPRDLNIVRSEIVRREIEVPLDDLAAIETAAAATPRTVPA